MLFHLPDPVRALRGGRRVLRPAGTGRSVDVGRGSGRRGVEGLGRRARRAGRPRARADPSQARADEHDRQDSQAAVRRRPGYGQAVLERLEHTRDVESLFALHAGFGRAKRKLDSLVSPTRGAFLERMRAQLAGLRRRLYGTRDSCVQCGRVPGLTAGYMPAAGRLMDEDRSIRRRLSAILAADIAGYSRLMGQDEAATVRDLKGHQAAILPLVERHGGRVIDTAGDGILAEFPSVVGATACAAEIQRVMAARNAEAPEGRRMLFRIGVNLGDVIHDDTRIYGDGINIAARLEGLAEPGGMLVSQTVHEQVRDRLGPAFKDLGGRTLKNIARPVRVYRVRERAAPAEPAPAPTGALSLPDKPSIAVLPFSNMSGDADQEFFADGIAEDI